MRQTDIGELLRLGIKLHQPVRQGDGKPDVLVFVGANGVRINPFTPKETLGNLVELELSALRVELNQLARQCAGDVHAPVLKLGGAVRAVGAGENADRQAYSAQATADLVIRFQRDIDHFDRIGLAIQDEDDILAFVDAVELLIITDHGVVDERQRITGMPFLNARLGHFGTEWSRLYGDYRFAIESIDVQLLDALVFAIRDVGAIAFHAPDGFAPFAFGARAAGQAVALLMAIAALGDECVFGSLIRKGQGGGVRRGGQCVGNFLWIGQLDQRQVVLLLGIHRQIEIDVEVFVVVGTTAQLHLAGETGVERIFSRRVGIDGFLSVPGFVPHRDQGAGHRLTIGGGHQSAEGGSVDGSYGDGGQAKGGERQAKIDHHDGPLSRTDKKRCGQPI